MRGQAPPLHLRRSSPRRRAAQDRAIPFWPDSVPAAIHAEVDGVAALETVRELGRFHRVQGSPGFAAAAELMKQKAIAAGSPTRRSSASRRTARRSTPTSCRTSAGTPCRPRSRRSRRRSGSSPPSPTCRSRSRTTVRMPTRRPNSSTSARAPPPRTTRERTFEERSSWPTGRCRSSTASRARSGAPPVSSPTIRTSRPRGRATTATSSAGVTCRRTSSRTVLPSWSRSDKPRTSARAWRRARRSCCAPAWRPAWCRRRTTSSSRRSRARNPPPARSWSRRTSVTNRRAPTTTRPAAPRSWKSAAPSPRRSGNTPSRPRPARSDSFGCPRSRAPRRISSGIRRSSLAWSRAFTWTWSEGSSRRRRAPSTSRAPPKRCPTSPTSSPPRGSIRSSPPPRATPRARATPSRASYGRRARGRCCSATCGASTWEAITRSSRPRDSACRWSTFTTTPTSRSTPRRTSPRTSTRPSSAASPTWEPASSTPWPPCRKARSRACSP